MILLLGMHFVKRIFPKLHPNWRAIVEKSYLTKCTNFSGACLGAWFWLNLGGLEPLGPPAGAASGYPIHAIEATAQKTLHCRHMT